MLELTGESYVSLSVAIMNSYFDYIKPGGFENLAIA